MNTSVISRLSLISSTLLYEYENEDEDDRFLKRTFHDSFKI